MDQITHIIKSRLRNTFGIKHRILKILARTFSFNDSYSNVCLILTRTHVFLLKPQVKLKLDSEQGLLPDFHI